MKAILRTTWQFVVYSNLYIVLVAGLMATEVYPLILHTQPDPQYILFVCFSTLSSYSLHWYFSGHSAVITPRTAWLKKNKNIHGYFLLAGLAGTAYTLFYFQQHLHWIAIAALATFLYTAPKLPIPALRQLRKVALGKTIFLAAVWTYVTVVLPVLISSQAWSERLTFFCISKYFLIYMICILFDYRDREDDKAAGVRSLITYLSPAAIQRLFYVSFALFLAGTFGAAAHAFSSYTIAALLAPGILCALLYRRATRIFRDTLYYVVLDGLMGFSALLHLFTVI